MTIENTIKKAEKLSGEKISVNENHQHWVNYKGHSVSFYPNGHFSLQAESTCFYTKRNDLKDDIQSDYFAGCFHDNITQAFKFLDTYVSRNN